MICVANQPRPAGPGSNNGGTLVRAIVSGNANSGAINGVVAVNVNNTATNANANISAVLTHPERPKVFQGQPDLMVEHPTQALCAHSRAAASRREPRRNQDEH